MQDISNAPTTIAAYSVAIASTLQQRGIDPGPVFEKCGIALQTTTDPMLRLSNNQVSCLFRESVIASGDPTFGLSVGETLHPGNLHAIGYALMSSTTLRDFAQRLCNYYRIVSQSANFHIEETPDAFLLVTVVSGEDICWETHDAFSVLMVRFIRIIYSPDFTPLRTELMRPHPGDYLQSYIDYFQCDLSFDRPKVVIAIAPNIVDTPLPGASKELAHLHDKNIMQYLKRLERQDIINRVRIIIIEELASGAITKQQVADKLCMNSRSLQMKLAHKNQSFQKILDSTRQSLALGYMEQSAISITEAAYLLGFSDVSNFTRAFKRWTGKPPREFRHSLGLRP